MLLHLLQPLAYGYSLNAIICSQTFLSGVTEAPSWRRGWAVLTRLLAAEQCDDLAGLYGDTPALRSQIIMARHAFGQGE